MTGVSNAVRGPWMAVPTRPDPRGELELCECGGPVFHAIIAAGLGRGLGMSLNWAPVGPEDGGVWALAPRSDDQQFASAVSPSDDDAVAGRYSEHEHPGQEF